MSYYDAKTASNIFRIAKGDYTVLVIATLIVNFTNILSFKARLQVQKIYAYNFHMKKLLIKCWWNWLQMRCHTTKWLSLLGANAS